MNEQRVSDELLEELRSCFASCALRIPITTSLIAGDLLAELQERHAQRCETCKFQYTWIAPMPSGDECRTLCERTASERVNYAAPDNGYCAWWESRKEPQPCQ